MIKKAILNELINTQDLNSLEQHLIFLYLTNNNLDFTKSPIPTYYFKNFEQNTKLYFDTSTLEIEIIKDLENHLELIICYSQKGFPLQSLIQTTINIAA